jgi:drug/metabolite transporter (DMT)-like permease
VCEYRLRRKNSSIVDNKCINSSIFDSVWPISKNWRTWLGLISRGIIGAMSVILRFLALKYLTVGDTAVIAYSYPVIVIIMGNFFLGEKCGVIPVIVSLTTVIGVCIVSKPTQLTGESFEMDRLV